MQEILNEIRKAAASGRYASYAVSHIELAALLFNDIVDDIPAKWRYLLDYLRDNKLPRSDRTLGFEVLSNTDHRIPNDLVDEFGPKVTLAIQSRDIPMMAPDIRFDSVSGGDHHAGGGTSRRVQAY
jgi:hypothetical protein